MAGSKSYYTQRYRPIWERKQEFKGWLRPFPGNPSKALCRVCNSIIKAHLFDLRKHGNARKHKKAFELYYLLNNEANPSQKYEVEPDDVSTDVEKILVTQFGALWSSFKDGKMNSPKNFHIWQEISDGLSANNCCLDPADCRKKILDLKNKFFEEISKLKDPDDVIYVDHHEIFCRVFEVEVKAVFLKLENGRNEDIGMLETVVLESGEFPYATIDYFLHVLLSTTTVLKATMNMESVWRMVTQIMEEQEIPLSMEDWQNTWENLLRKYLFCSNECYPRTKLQKRLSMIQHRLSSMCCENLDSEDAQNVELEWQEREEPTLMDTLLNKLESLHEEHTHLMKYTSELSKTSMVLKKENGLLRRLVAQMTKVTSGDQETNEAITLVIPKQDDSR